LYGFYLINLTVPQLGLLLLALFLCYGLPGKRRAAEA
jgi:hypothetical protein